MLTRMNYYENQIKLSVAKLDQVVVSWRNWKGKIRKIQLEDPWNEKDLAVIENTPASQRRMYKKYLARQKFYTYKKHYYKLKATPYEAKDNPLDYVTARDQAKARADEYHKKYREIMQFD